jgi:hypothetical protein
MRPIVSFGLNAAAACPIFGRHSVHARRGLQPPALLDFKQGETIFQG